MLEPYASRSQTEKKPGQQGLWLPQLDYYVLPQFKFQVKTNLSDYQ